MAVVSALLPAVLPAAAGAQSSVPDRPKLVFDGPVTAALPVDGATYVAGEFAAQLRPSSGLELADAGGAGQIASGRLPAFDGKVWTAVADGSGGFFVGGDFTTVGGVPRARLARIRADGTLDPAWAPGADGIVTELTRAGDALVAVGDFRTIGGQARSGMAVLDADDGTPTAFRSGVGSVWGVSGVDVAAGRVWVVGRLATEPADAPVSLLAVDLTTGAPTAWRPAPATTDAVTQSSLSAFAGSTVVGVEYADTAAGYGNRLVAYDDETGAVRWRSPLRTPQAFFTVRAIDGRIYVGEASYGLFTADLYALDPETGAEVWRAAGPFTGFRGGSIQDIDQRGDTVYVTGGFGRIGGGEQRLNAAAFDAATGAPRPWDPGIGSYGAGLLTVSGDQVLIGGLFTAAGPAVGRIPSVVRLKPDGSLDPSFHPGALDWGANPSGSSPVITRLALDGTTLYLGGRFERFAGQARSNLAAVDTGTGLLTPFAPVAGAVDRILTASGGRVSTGGPRGWTAGGDPQSWEPTPPPVYGLNAFSASALKGSTLYFATGAIDVGARSSLAWHPAPSGIHDPYTSPGPDVSAIVPDGDRVWLGGSFNAAGGVPRNRLAEVDATTGLATAWDPGADGTVEELAVDRGRVFAFGDFTHVGGEPRAGLAAIDATTARPVDWTPAPDGPAGGVAAGGGRAVLFGGWFTHVGGVTTGQYAQFTRADLPDPLRDGLARLLRTYDLRRPKGRVAAVDVPAAGRVRVAVRVGDYVVARGSAAAGGAGPLAVRVVPNDAGRLILSVYPHFAFSGTARFVPADGGVATVATAPVQAP